MRLSVSTKTQPIDRERAAVYHVSMATDMKRIAVFVPDDVYDALLQATELRREPLSQLGRRLFIEWLLREHPDLLSDGADAAPPGRPRAE